jgi:hypothetical protein
LLLALVNPAWLRSAALLANVTLPGEDTDVRYEQARPALDRLLRQADIVVTTSELETLYHLGRYDILLNRSRLSELPGDQKREFGDDWRTGRPVISSRASLTLVMDCFASGLIVSNRRQWGHGYFVDEPTAALITERAQPVPLPRQSGVLAWTWATPDNQTRPADCARIPVPPHARSQGG